MDGMDNEYEYSMVGHSGTSPEAEHLINWSEPPQGARRRLQLLQKMAAHAQYCHPGDTTFEATNLAIQEAARRAAPVQSVAEAVAEAAAGVVAGAAALAVAETVAEEVKDAVTEAAALGSGLQLNTEPS